MAIADSDFIVNIPPRADSLEIVNQLLKHMIDIGGSDIFFIGGGEVWCSRYGKKVKLTSRRLSDKEVMGIIGLIYNQNAAAMLGGQKPIDAAHEFQISDETSGFHTSSQRFRFRVNAVGCLRGGRRSITVTIRSIPTAPPKWDALGIEPVIVETSRNLDQGLILVVGATGNGKSTLLASVLRDRIEIPDSHTNLVTIEKPIEFVYDEIDKPTSLVSQLQVGVDVDSFHHGVVNALRMAPNVILIGETRDLETTQASLEASMTGHGVFSTVHANNVPETFQRLVYVYPENMQQQAKVDIVQPMKMVVAQRLIPTVDGKRTAIREFMVFEQDHKERIMASKNFASEAFKLVNEFGRPMIEDATEKYQDGIISEEWFRRINANYASLRDTFK